MGKRFIISVNNTNKEQEEAFVEYIKKNGLGWWHWLSHTWLLVDVKGKLDISDLRDSVRDIFKLEYNLVIEINGTVDTWAGFGPSSEDKNMFEWLKENWK